MADATWTPAASEKLHQLYVAAGGAGTALGTRGRSTATTRVFRTLAGTWTHNRSPLAIRPCNGISAGRMPVAGEIDVSFCYTNGAKRPEHCRMDFAAGKWKGNCPSRHAGIAQHHAKGCHDGRDFTESVLHLPGAQSRGDGVKPRPQCSDRGGTNRAGIVYLPNGELDDEQDFFYIAGAGLFAASAHAQLFNICCLPPVPPGRAAPMA